MLCSILVRAGYPAQHKCAFAPMLTYLVINSGALFSLYDHKILILNDLVSWPVLCFEIAMMLDKSMHCRVTVVQQSEFSVRRDSWIRYSYQEMDPAGRRDDKERAVCSRDS